MSKKVNYARFHTPVFIRGSGDLGTALPSTLKRLEGLSMSVEVIGLLIETANGGKKVKTLVPWPNVITAELDAKE